MKKPVSLFILFLILISSCKKEQDAAPQQPPPQPPVQLNYLGESIIPYKFKQGSYWVYQNDSTAALDSIYVDSVSSGFITTTPSTHGTTTEVRNEFYKMYMHNVSAALHYNETLTARRYIYRNHSGSWSTGFYGQPIYTSDSPIGAGYNGMQITAKFLSANINSTAFSNVDEVKITAASQYDPQFDHDTYLYYCDSVGLLKKETIITPGTIESWSLLRWNVIR